MCCANSRLVQGRPFADLGANREYFYWHGGVFLFSCLCVSLLSFDACVRFARFFAVGAFGRKSVVPALFGVGSWVSRNLHVMSHALINSNSEVKTNARLVRTPVLPGIVFSTFVWRSHLRRYTAQLRL